MQKTGQPTDGRSILRSWCERLSGALEIPDHAASVTAPSFVPAIEQDQNGTQPVKAHEDLHTVSNYKQEKQSAGISCIYQRLKTMKDNQATAESYLPVVMEKETFFKGLRKVRSLPSFEKKQLEFEKTLSALQKRVEELEETVARFNSVATEGSLSQIPERKDNPTSSSQEPLDVNEWSEEEVHLYVEDFMSNKVLKKSLESPIKEDSDVPRSVLTSSESLIDDKFLKLLTEFECEEKDTDHCNKITLFELREYDLSDRDLTEGEKEDSAFCILAQYLTNLETARRIHTAIIALLGKDSLPIIENMYRNAFTEASVNQNSISFYKSGLSSPIGTIYLSIDFLNELQWVPVKEISLEENIQSKLEPEVSTEATTSDSDTERESSSSAQEKPSLVVSSQQPPEVKASKNTKNNKRGSELLKRRRKREAANRKKLSEYNSTLRAINACLKTPGVRLKNLSEVAEFIKERESDGNLFSSWVSKALKKPSLHPEK